MSAITATRIPISQATGVFKLSTCCVICSFIRSSDAWIFASNRFSDAAISSLTIKRIWLRSASVNSPRAGQSDHRKEYREGEYRFHGVFQCQSIYPPAKVGGWQTCLAASFAVPPKTGHSYYTTFGGKKASRFLIRREPYRERHDLTISAVLVWSSSRNSDRSCPRSGSFELRRALRLPLKTLTIDLL